jgi:hypothetical protein
LFFWQVEITLLAIMQTYRSGEERSSVLISPTAPLKMEGTKATRFLPAAGTVVTRLDPRRAVLALSIDARFFEGLPRGETTLAVQGAAKIRDGASSVQQDTIFRVDVGLMALPSSRPSAVPSASVLPSALRTSSPSGLLNGLPERMEVRGEPCSGRALFPFCSHLPTDR